MNIADRFAGKIDFDFDVFEQLTYEAAHAIFLKLQQDRHQETFYTFNFLTGDIMHTIYIDVNTEENLERTARTQLREYASRDDVSVEDLKQALRFETFWYISMKTYESDLVGPIGMLRSLQRQLSELENELLFVHDAEVDEHDFFDYVFDTYDEPIVERLKNVLRRLDNEKLFELTNTRENIHLGLLRTSAHGELEGPFRDINPPASCERYREDAAAYRRATVKLG